MAGESCRISWISARTPSDGKVMVAMRMVTVAKRTGGLIDCFFIKDQYLN